MPDRCLGNERNGAALRRSHLDLGYPMDHHEIVVPKPILCVIHVTDTNGSIRDYPVIAPSYYANHVNGDYVC